MKVIVWQTGHVSLWRPQTPTRKKFIANLKSQKEVLAPQLKVHKWGFGPLAPSVFNCTTKAGMEVKVWQTGHVSLWRPQTPTRKKIYCHLQSPKKRFWPPS